MKIGAIVGSLSKNSINRKLLKALARHAPVEMEIVEIPIGDLPLFNRDLESDFPQAARELKDRIESCDAMLYLTPEYNRSIPGPMKNALDWASRPYGQNSLGLPSATIGASPGKLSTAVGQQSLKQILLFCGAPVMGQPEGYLQFEEGLIDDEGHVANPAVDEFLEKWIHAFGRFVTEETNA